MSASLNSIQLIGNVGKNPEITYRQKGNVAWVRLSLATTIPFTAKGKIGNRTAWHSLIFQGKQAELVSRFVRQGMQLYVEGSLEYRHITHKTFGINITLPEIRVSRFIMTQRVPMPSASTER